KDKEEKEKEEKKKDEGPEIGVDRSTAKRLSGPPERAISGAKPAAPAPTGSSAAAPMRRDPRGPTEVVPAAQYRALEEKLHKLSTANHALRQEAKALHTELRGLTQKYRALEKEHQVRSVH